MLLSSSLLGTWARIADKSSRSRHCWPQHRKEALGLEVGDWIVWKDRQFEILDEQGNLAILPGMKGKVVQLSDGLAPYTLDGRDTAVLPWALVEFENGHLATVDMEMKGEKVLDE